LVKSSGYGVHFATMEEVLYFGVDEEDGGYGEGEVDDVLLYLQFDGA
jgi:hypothetical protein